MDDQIKLSIDGRKAAFENTYELSPDAKKKSILSSKRLKRSEKNAKIPLISRQN
jgi:hypothetical protein